MPTQEKSSSNPSTISSWVQLLLFTAFLFLLVAIPYTLYNKVHSPQHSAVIANLPVATKLPIPPLTPPAASTTTTCLPVPPTYENKNATPAAYLFHKTKKQLCFPPALPPFPFTWQSYISYQNDYALDTPTNWADVSTTIKATTIHMFASSTDTSATNTAIISFAFYSGQDPYATDSSYLQQLVTRGGKTGTIYTKGDTYIAAVFALTKGFLRLESSTSDSSFFAFEHMLDSITFK